MLCTIKNSTDAIKKAASFNERFVIYGVDKEVLFQCVDMGVFDSLKATKDYIIVSDESDHIGEMLCHNDVCLGLVCELGALYTYDFHWAIILSKENPQRAFEKLVAISRIQYNNIFLSPEAWEDRYYRADDILSRALSRTYSEADEGGISPELPSQFVDCLLEIKRRNIPGDILNLGVYKGWSIQLIAEICNEIGLLDRKIVGFDTFSGFPLKSASLLDGFTQTNPENRKNIFKDTSLEYVTNKLSSYNVALVKGDIIDTVKEIKGMRLSFIFFDMDDYTPTKLALRPVFDVLSQGGFIVHDHYVLPTCYISDTYGQRVAMSEFIAEYPMFNITGTNIFIKT